MTLPVISKISKSTWVRSQMADLEQDKISLLRALVK